MKRRTNVTCNQKKRSKATKTSAATPRLWLYAVAVAVAARHAADCTFTEGASSGAGRKRKQPLRSEKSLASTLPLLSNNTVNTDNSFNWKHYSSGSHSDYYYYCSYYGCSCMNVHYPSFILKGFSFIGDLLLGRAGPRGGLYRQLLWVPACKFPCSVWHEHVTCNCIKKMASSSDRVGGLNLHSSFAPVRKEDHKIILKTIAITGSIL